MARNIQIKPRGVKNRKQKVVYLFIAEGQNKTETLYFSHYQSNGRYYNIIFVKAGSSTDAKSLYKTISLRWKKEGLNYAAGDRAFIIVDIDNDKDKVEKLKAIIKSNSNPGIQFIVSNPTFEIWFLLHHKYTTKYFEDGAAVIKELRKHLPEYEKNSDVYPLLEEKLENALKNAQKLEKHFEGQNWPDVLCNPRTDVGMLVELLELSL